MSDGELPGKTPMYWFRAKRFGWGVGAPCSWQGWTALIVYIGVLAGSQALLGRGTGNGVVIIVATFAIVVVLVAKREPAARR